MTTSATAPQFDFETVPGDPMGVKIYTLSNGMKLMLSVNSDEPRINTNIAVRAGSKHDPAETTGLAHYLEHMLFKGTSKIASLDWEKEKDLLQQISDLYEQHRKEKDPEKRKTIYAEIDRISGEAANYVAANEYDKMVSSMGAKGTNAYTWVEQTVYVNDIPANELERWMELESERFRQCVLRLFHTELEAVYEEFNISQDNDFRKVNKVVSETLFPNHPYGTQTTIGTGEHLKNPSHVKIQEYFQTYYVPNNMAIVLSGDFDPNKAALLAEKYFGGYQPKPVPPFSFSPQPEILEPVRKDVFGQEAAYVEISWRFDGANSRDALMLSLMRSLLYNRRAGIIDLNLMQKQLLLEASASSTSYEDYSVFRLYGKPREGQTLEEVEQLLLDQVEALKNGQFEDWLMEAVIKDFKLSEMRRNESNGARVGLMTNSFILGVPWEKFVRQFDDMAGISKADMLRFAKERLRNNFVCIYKRTGEDPGVVKVDKPVITPISVNRSASSEYAETFLTKEAPRLEPVFLDFDNQIRTQTLSCGVPLDYIHNSTNPTFVLDYILEMGKSHDPLLAMAVSYLPYLGTDQYTPEQLKQEFFRLGLAFNVSVADQRIFVTLSGLDESFEAGVKLFEHLLEKVKGDPEALKNLVADILVKRANATKDKRVILRQAMFNYAKSGEKNSFTDNIPEETLKTIQPEELVKRIKDISTYEHRVFYYGSLQQDQVASIVDRHHKIPAQLKPINAVAKYPELEQAQTEVLFVDFPMVQAEMLWLSKGSPNFEMEEFIMANLYNEYFGSGLSSIVFQEIRESKALAYSAYAAYTSPSYADQGHYLQAYVGTQVDKLADAVPAMMEIVENMPVSEAQIENARQAILRKIETERIVKDDIYWTYRFAEQRGLDRDIRKDVYDRMQTITAQDLINFQNNHVKGRNYTLLVLGSKDKVDMEYLKTLGPVKELTLSQIFGFEVKP
ncbi:MAG: insulinase family protein [Saprospirales bacterium]|nr:insulinase family protein [Saprospirales bacterium]MBK7337369.1 insulinase family protein [Saprospirales bacterium]